jgi:hypothetical protein
MSEPTPAPPAELGALAAELATVRRQLDHLDDMLHDVLRFIADNRPALERATTLLDTGRPMRAWLDTRRKATRNGS